MSIHTKKHTKNSKINSVDHIAKLSTNFNTDHADIIMNDVFIKDNDAQNKDALIVKKFTNADYSATHEKMLKRTLRRVELLKQKQPTEADELWIVDHNDVYTLGQAGKSEHILQRNATPIIKTDRGGQVTWHGHGQLVLYWLFDLNRLDWKVRDLVSHAEQAIEDVVNAYVKPLNYIAKARPEAPGVYIYDENLHMLGKVASLGFKIKQGFSYHGIALNIDCDLLAFDAINPCGYAGMRMLKLIDYYTPSQTQNFYEEVTQTLVNNISLRHRGQIELRSI